MVMNMLKKALVEHCSPTLAGIKTGNMFSVYNDSTDTIEEIRKLNRIMTRKGLCLIPLKKTQRSTLVYLYRPNLLERDLDLPEAEEILEKKGYPCGNTGCCIAHLVRHIMEDEQFPHEIGLFLGYPPSDVRGFMEDSRKGVKCSGCWKVYGKECEAKKLFDKYEKCREIYCEEIRKGKPLEALIVDTRKGLRPAI